MEEILGQVQNPIGMGLPFRHTRIIGAFVDAFFCQIQKKMDEDGTEENVLNHLETVKAQYRAPAIIESPKFRKFVKKLVKAFKKETKSEVKTVFKKKLHLIEHYLTIRYERNVHFV